MAHKTILLKYLEIREEVVVPKEKSTTDLAFLESSFHSLFKFQEQVNLQITFQRFDGFCELVDLDEGNELNDMEKLNVIVTPVLVTPPAVSFTGVV